MDAKKWNKVKGLDLGTVKAKLRSRKGWWWNLRNDVDRIEAEYRQFLYLIATHPGETVVPWSQQVDDFWHEHILDTRKYETDCKAIVGRVIHHNPHLAEGGDKQRKAFRKTREMYRNTFGEPSKSKGNNSSDSDFGFIPIVFCGGSPSSCSSHSCSSHSCSSHSCSSCSSCGSGCGGN